MKKFKRCVFAIATATIVAITLHSCAGINSLSDEDAYGLGRGIGKTLNYYLNN